MKALTTTQIEAMVDNGQTIYVRWSRGPAKDTKPSRDYLNGGQHQGLSAVKIGNWGGEYLARRLAEYRFLQIKDLKIQAYIYTGVECGLDSDGYELLAVDSIHCLGRWTEK